jgi:hypothetical protein
MRGPSGRNGTGRRPLTLVDGLSRQWARTVISGSLAAPGIRSLSDLHLVFGVDGIWVTLCRKMIIVVTNNLIFSMSTVTQVEDDVKKMLDRLMKEINARS